eukprot:scaffold146549_cov37-Tisochrysis_lutea.AAC.2
MHGSQKAIYVEEASERGSSRGHPTSGDKEVLDISSYCYKLWPDDLCPSLRPPRSRWSTAKLSLLGGKSPSLCYGFARGETRGNLSLRSYDKEFGPPDQPEILSNPNFPTSTGECRAPRS